MTFWHFVWMVLAAVLVLVIFNCQMNSLGL